MSPLHEQTERVGSTSTRPRDKTQEIEASSNLYFFLQPFRILFSAGSSEEFLGKAFMYFQ